MWRRFVRWAIACAAVCCATAVTPLLAETFTEELLLQPLPGGKIAAHFHFQTEGPSGGSHTLFPRVVDQLWALTNVSQFHLALTQGRWHAGSWGRPVLPAPPAGAQLRARFQSGVPPQDVRSSWGALAHGLSGIFCGSLNFLDSQEHTAQPSFVYSPDSTPRTGWTYGTLPREAVCTENLTPWLRLLPCRDAAGLAALLRGPTVFSSPFASLAASLTAVPTGHGVRLRLAQTLTLLLPAGKVGDWSLGSLFGSSEGARACPLAARSSVHVRMPWHDGKPPGTPQQGSQQLGLFPAPAATHSDGDHVLLEYPLPPASASAPLNLQWQRGETALSQTVERPALSVRRHMTGRGEERGRIALQVDLLASACSGSHGAQLCVLQAVPWWAQLWLHTLRLRYDSQAMCNEVQAVAMETAITKRRIVPAEDRTSLAQLEICLAVPDGTSSVSLSIDFQKAFLTVFEHPPDASRGLDLPAAIVTLLPAAGDGRLAHAQPADTPLFEHMQDEHAEQVVSEGAVTQLAQPDFSMPYNVCCLTSTVLAVYLGAMLNALLQREAPKRTPQQEAAASRQRRLRVAAVVVLFGGAAVYLDKGLQNSVRRQLQALGVAAF